MEIDHPQESYEEPTLDSDLALKARLSVGNSITAVIFFSNPTGNRTRFRPFTPKYTRNRTEFDD
jgi:hypothetical protein